MNQLKLTELADLAIADLPGAWNIPDEFLANFAELIVRECLSVIEEMNPHDPERDIDDIFDEVNEHFGVKG